MDCLNKTIESFLKEYPPEKTLWIAYSGGLDSQILLHLCAQYAKSHRVRFKAIHVNHGIHPHANDWAIQCEETARFYGIDCIQESIQIPRHSGESLEAAARAARYAVFSRYLDTDEVILTAHHQDDQAETVLLQLLRGAGPKGLSAMPVQKSFGKGFLIRPLLSFSRDELNAYAVRHQLQWIEDDSNHNLDYARNFLRHRVIPLLKTRWPSVSKTLLRAAKQCGEMQCFLDAEIKKLLQACQIDSANTLCLSSLKVLNSHQQRHVLRAWIQDNGFPLPSEIKLNEICRVMLTAEVDKTPMVDWRSTEIRRYQNRLYIMKPISALNTRVRIEWDFKYPVPLPTGQSLIARRVIGAGLRCDLSKVTIRFRQGGERVKLPHRSCHHDLKKCFQRWGVLPWERNRIPLLCDNDRVIAVLGYFLDAEYAASACEEGIVTDCFKSPVSQLDV